MGLTLANGVNDHHAILGTSSAFADIAALPRSRLDL